MRIVCSALLVAGAAWLAGSSGALAAPVNGGAIKAAVDDIGLSESVHCRRFRHGHRYGHGFSRGCGGVVIYNDRPRLRMRYGVRTHDYGTRVRGGVTIRGEERGTIRSGSRRDSTTIRSGGGRDGGGGATMRSGGGGGEGAARAGGGQNQRTPGTAGSMTGSPTGGGGGGGGGGQGGGGGGGGSQKQ